MDRDINRSDVTGARTTESNVDIRRGMVMGRDLGVTTQHPEMVENMAIGRLEKVEPFGSDLVHWGSIWGGFFAYLAVVAILGAIGISAGAIAVTPANAPPAGASAGTVGAGVAIVMLIATFVGALLAGWTSNLRSRWPSVVNGLIYGSFVLTVPLLFALMVGAMTTAATAGALANAQALRGGVFRPGVAGINMGALDTIASNVGWFSLGAIILLALSAVGYYLGMRMHMRDLGLVPAPTRERLRT